MQYANLPDLHQTQTNTVKTYVYIFLVAAQAWRENMKVGKEVATSMLLTY